MGRAMKCQKQFQIMCDHFHGDVTEDWISHTHLCAIGQGIFENMWKYKSDCTFSFQVIVLKKTQGTIIKGLLDMVNILI